MKRFPMFVYRVYGLSLRQKLAEKKCFSKNCTFFSLQMKWFNFVHNMTAGKIHFNDLFLHIYLRQKCLHWTCGRLHWMRMLFQFVKVVNKFHILKLNSDFVFFFPISSRLFGSKRPCNWIQPNGTSPKIGGHVTRSWYEKFIHKISVTTHA